MEYQARVLQPVALEARLRARSLESEGLAAFARTQAGRPDLAWPPQKFGADALTWVAWFFSPEIEVARAKVAVAEAALQTAKQRINPSISGDGGRNKTDNSIATYSLTPSFVIETAGKRGLRILTAEKELEAARIGVHEAAWAVRSRVRNTLAAYTVAAQRVESAQAEAALRSEVVQILEKRLQAGEAARPQLNAALADRAAADAALVAANGERDKTLAELDGAVGIPIESARLDTTLEFRDPAANQTVKAGLLHRAEVRRALVEYEVVDTKLRMAIAQQYPDIPLSPGYQYQEGFSQYTLGAAIASLPVFHRNQGPIAEAEAARKQAEAEFVAVQAKVLAETRTAQARLREARADWEAVRDAWQKTSTTRETEARRALQAGEFGRLDVATAQLEGIALRRARDDAFERAAMAQRALEDAIESPVEVLK